MTKMNSLPRIVEVRRWRGSVTVKLSNGVSMPGNTPEEIREIAEASMHSVQEVQEAIENDDDEEEEEPTEISTISEMCELLARRDISHHVEDGTVVVTGDVDVYLNSLESLNVPITFRNERCVSLRGLTSVSAPMTFANGSGVYLDGLTSVSAPMTFANEWHVSLPRLTSVSAPTTFANEWHVALPSLTSATAPMTFDNRRSVDLPRLKSLTTRGVTIELECIDSITMQVLRRTHLPDGVELLKCRYFRGGPLSKLPPCYVAKVDGYTAHGETAEKAISDARFKKLVKTLDVNELVAGIKQRCEVTFIEYRLLTGACEDGLREGLERLGLSPDTESLPLNDVVRLSRGQYGGARIAELLG